MDGLFGGGTLLGVSLGITKVVDWIRSRFDSAGRAPKDLWILVAMAIGIALSVRTGLNALSSMSWANNLSQLEGQIATGVLLGGGASLGHEGMDLLSGIAKSKHAAAAKTSMQTYRPPGPGDEEHFDS